MATRVRNNEQLRRMFDYGDGINYCCGVRELHGVDEASAHEALAYLAAECDGGPRCVVFSSAQKVSSRAKPNATKLAELLREIGIGKVSEPSVTINGNTDNRLTVYMYSYDQADEAKLKKWVNANIIEDAIDRGWAKKHSMWGY